MSHHRVIIIGSGPAGYTAAIYAARAGLEPVVFAGELDEGGALMTTTDVENFPGFPDGVQGPDLMANLRSQAERFGADIRYEDVTKVDLTQQPKQIWVDEDEYTSDAVIIATGSAYRHLGIEREDELSGKGVSWCATCDGFFFKDKDIVVVGGGDSAVEEATFLTRFGKTVTLVHRRDELRASKIMADRALANDKITFAWNTQVEEILGDVSVEGVVLRDTLTGEKRNMEADGLFIAVGHDPRSGLFAGQIDIDNEGYIQVAHPTTATTIPGVFAAGDVVDSRYRQAITAAGTGCAAALDAERYLVELAEELEAASADLTA